MKDVDRDARAFADGDRFLDALAQLVAVVAQVRRVKPAGRAGRSRQRDQLVESWRTRSASRSGRWRRRDAPCCIASATSARHLLQLRRLRRALVVAHHDLADLAEADVRQQVDRRLRRARSPRSSRVKSRPAARSAVGFCGATEPLSPITSVVTPWRILLSALPSVEQR